MHPVEQRWPFRDELLDLAWVLFAAANLVAMAALPEWETVPFHFIWVSLTLVYGFRVWKTGRTALALGGVMLLTGVLLWREVIAGAQPPDELTEVPLMASMFVVMVWHARRRLIATGEVQRVSDDNRRLLEREKRFVQDASHQLRTPITIALGHAELLARAQPQEASTAEDAHIVVEELQRLRRLADLLLRIVGTEERRVHRPTEVHLDVMVAETVRRWMVTPRGWSLDRLDSATTIGDADQLQMAIDELIQNAVTHTRPDDRIGLEVRASAGWVDVRVKDTGTGIARGDLPRIFDRFARSETPGQERKDGLGLGLAFVHSVAASHRGSVSVESAPGAGSTFDLWLPAAANGNGRGTGSDEPERDELGGQTHDAVPIAFLSSEASAE
jgi:two-component system OmpR family sensor kinase